MNTKQVPKNLLSDFEAVSGQSSLRKILVIGERGIGKSTLLNKLLGFNEYKLPNDDYYLTHPLSPFNTGNNRDDGVTTETQFAKGRVFNQSENPEYMFIDMPGVLEDLNKDENIQQNLNDLTGKLKMLQDITGVLVLIDNEDFTKSVELSKEDFINDGVIMILIAIQVIFEEQLKEDFAMNLAFGLSRCDPQNEHIWGVLKKDKKEVLEAIYNQLLENGIQVPSKDMPLFYLSSRETIGTEMSQRHDFEHMMEFFESRMEDDARRIVIPEFAGDEIIGRTESQLLGRRSTLLKKDANENLNNILKTMKGEEVSKDESEESEENVDGEIRKITNKINIMQQKIEEYNDSGHELRILFKYTQKEPLGFLEKIFSKTLNYEGFVNIEKIDNNGYEILEGGVNSTYCKVKKPLVVTPDDDFEITAYGYFKNFKTFKIAQEERKNTIQSILKYKEFLVTKKEQEADK